MSFRAGKCFLACALFAQWLSACQTYPKRVTDQTNPALADILSKKCAAYGIYIIDEHKHAAHLAQLKADAISPDDINIMYRIVYYELRKTPQYCVHYVREIRSATPPFLHLALKK